MRRLWLVANPYAGRGLALPLAQGALPALERAGWSCRIEATARAGHARQLAERALEAGADGLL